MKMRNYFLPILMMVVTTSCHAKQPSICVESASVVEENLSHSTNSTDQILLAVVFKNKEITKPDLAIILRENRLDDLLSIVATKGDVAVMGQLLELGIDPNSAIEGGAPILAGVSECGNTALAELLIRDGANIYAHDPNYVDAMTVAITNDQPKIVELLIRHGYTPNESSPSGRLVIRIANRMHGGKYQYILSKTNGL